VTFSLKNNQGVTIWYVYFSPTSSGTWGSDKLGPMEVIHPGDTHYFTTAPGYYDFKIEGNGHVILDTAWNILVDHTHNAFTTP
jgi:hypothetical protein